MYGVCVRALVEGRSEAGGGTQGLSSCVDGWIEWVGEREKVPRHVELSLAME